MPITNASDTGKINKIIEKLDKLSESMTDLNIGITAIRKELAIIKSKIDD